MNILMIGADQNNPTDGVIVKGIKNLLSKAYDNFRYKYLFLNDHEDMNYQADEKFDLLIVCGTPWLWDSFQRSKKYENLYNIFQAHKESKKLFMGIGTCLNLGDIYSDILRRPQEIEGMHKLFNDATIITRDHLANELLINASIKNYLLPCPAFFSYDDREKSYKTYNVLLWTDPQKTISKGDWKSERKLKEYYKTFTDFNTNFNPVVYCAFPEEIPKAIEIGLPEPKVLSGFQETLDIMYNANNVLSGRVHCAVPAFSRGATVKLMPLDTRSYTLEDFRETLNLEEAEKEYIRILSEILLES